MPNVITHRFGESSVTDFNKADEIEIQRDVNYCLYYFSSVPHMFSIGKEKISKETYQYSVVYTCESTPRPQSNYQIAFVFDVTPVGIHYNREEFTVLQVFTSVAAIIAGTYVIMGILKSSLENLF